MVRTVRVPSYGLAMPLSLRERLRSVGRESLYRNALYIMASAAIPMLAGFAFWIVAARLLPAAEVGRAAALVSAMLFVAIVTNLGMGQVYISRLHSRASGEEWSLTVNSGLLLTGAASLVGGTAAAVTLPWIIPSLSDGVGSASFVLFPLGVAGSAWSLVLDHVSIAERHARPVLVRTVAAALARLGLVGLTDVVPVDGVTWIVISWTTTFLVFDLAAATLILPRLGRGYRVTLAGARSELRAMRGLIAGHQSINLGVQSAGYVLPLIVSARLGPAENAYFYTAFMMSSAVTFIAPAVTDALFAEGAHSPATLRRDVRRAAGQILALAGPPAAVLLVAGPSLLGLFGPQYPEEGGTLLRILVGSSVFGAGLMLAMAVLRVRGQLREGAVATFAALVVSITASWFLLPPLGLPGAGVGWSLGLAAGMILAFLFVRSGQTTDRSRQPSDALAGARGGS